MKKNLALFYFILLHVFPSFSCLNYYDYSLKGGHVELSDDYSYLTPERIAKSRTNRQQEIKEELAAFNNKVNWTAREASDYATLLMMDLQLRKAKTILDTLLQKDSLNYTYNANYGTLMELMGNNEAALKFIKRSVKINPDSHNGSEWIHVKILEAKLAMYYDAKWTMHHHVLGKKLSQSAIEDIIYQLNERTFFIQPKDFIVADLFFTLGETIIQHDQGVIFARQAYELSIYYGYWNKTACEKRLTLLSFYPKTYTNGDDFQYYRQLFVSCFIFLLMGFIFVWSYKRARQVNPR